MGGMVVVGRQADMAGANARLRPFAILDGVLIAQTCHVPKPGVTSHRVTSRYVVGARPTTRASGLVGVG